MRDPGCNNDRCVVTGVGAVSSLGVGVEVMWQALRAGGEGIRPIRRFTVDGAAVQLGALVPGHDLDPEHSDDPRRSLCVTYALLAAREALSQARAQEAVAPDRLALVLGTSSGDRVEQPHRLAEVLALALPALGPRVTVCTACASSTHALGLGRDLLRLGAADLVLAGGTDVLTPEIFASFHILGLLSPRPCAPFGAPPGTTMGEGAGFVVLERLGAARRRGAAILGELLGYGLSADAYHPTTPDPTGSGVTRALLGALGDAGLEPAAVDYVNAHGTGTETNDPAEWRAVQRVFGAALPVTSLKGGLGHAQGAAGVLEIIASLRGLGEQIIPPTLHHERGRPDGPRTVVTRAWPQPHRVVACTNSGFGGANAAVLIGAAPAVDEAAPAAAPRADVWLHGAAAVGPHGLELSRLVDAVERGVEPGLGRRAPEVSLAAIAPSVDPRSLDRSAGLLLCAAALSLRDGRHAVRGAARDRTGLFVGTTRIGPRTARDYDRSIRAHGLLRLSAGLIPHMVLNAAAGLCAMGLSLRGPTTTVTIGAGSGLLAILHAAEWLSRRADADAIVAGGVDELDPPPPGDEPAGDGADPGEGAACVLLRREPSPVLVSGWGLGGPGQLAAAVAQALRGGGRGPAQVDLVFGGAREQAQLPDDDRLRGARWRDLTPLVGEMPAAGAALATAAGAALLRRGAAGSVLITAAGASTAALLLTHEPTDQPTEGGAS